MPNHARYNLSARTGEAVRGLLAAARAGNGSRLMTKIRRVRHAMPATHKAFAVNADGDKKPRPWGTGIFNANNA